MEYCDALLLLHRIQRLVAFEIQMDSTGKSQVYTDATFVRGGCLGNSSSQS